MNFAKGSAVHRLTQWKDAASRLWEAQSESGESRTIALDDETFEICSEWASARQTTVSNIAAEFIRQYAEERRSQLARKATRRQLENNPLLALDSFTRLLQVKGETDDE